jgi:hypothetical protein
MKFLRELFPRDVDKKDRKIAVIVAIVCSLFILTVMAILVFYFL